MAVTLPRGRAIPPRPIDYPTSDGKPMAETDWHIEQMIYLLNALDIRYAGQPDVYISGNNFFYWQEGDPKKRVSPDVYVVFGVDKRPRDCYKVWEEGGKTPDVVFEITSKKTRREDTHTKRRLYERVLKVSEYFLFDPKGDYLRPRLQGYRLVREEYVPLELVDGRLYSERLGLELVEAGENLYLYKPVRRERLLTALELAQRAVEEAAARAVADQRAAEAAQRAEAADRRAEEESRRAVEEAAARAAADQRAEDESAARATAEAESARLRAELETLRRQLGQE